MLASVKSYVRGWKEYLGLPNEARTEVRKDDSGLPEKDEGIDATVAMALQWLARAQDCSKTHDGGVAHSYSLISGWGSSYPETTGYIIPTVLECARILQEPDLTSRAKRMLDWLVSIQLHNGSFQGGMIDQTPVVGVTFNTGQILIGLAAGTCEFGEPYRHAMLRAARWLVESQDPDGCWRKHPTPFANPGEKSYETHVAWGLLEADRIAPGNGFGEAGLKNIRWALTAQQPNGWFQKCCLGDPHVPLTHTIGYVLRGILEGYRFAQDESFLKAAQRTANGLLSVIRPDGFIPGRLQADWSEADSWACLTGTVQIAHSWLLLFRITGDRRYRDAAFLANQYVRRTISINGSPDVRGGVKGSFPINGGYGTYLYLNWACKFFIDSNLLERSVRNSPDR